MAFLETVSKEKLEGDMIVAFFYDDGTTIWIIITDGEITKRVLQRPIKDDAP
jgi:hypothetical protein